MWNVSSQFMFGDSILVAPKLIKSEEILSKFKQYLVNYILPEDEIWYNYYSKAQIRETGQWKVTTLPDL